MFRLLFENHGQVCANVSGRGFSRQQEARVWRHANLYRTRNCLQFPQPIGGRIAADVHTSGDSVDLEIIHRAFNINCTARRGGIHLVAWIADADGTGSGVDFEVALDVGDDDVTGGARTPQYSPNFAHINTTPP